MLIAKGDVIQGPWKEPAPKNIRAAVRSLVRRPTLAEAALIGVAAGAAGKLGAEYKRNPQEFRQTFRDQAAKDRENRKRWKANKTPMRERMREIKEQRPVSKRVCMPNGVVAVGDIAKSNIREYPYLPEWVKDSFAATTTRNVLNPTDLYASSRIMVTSAARADGKRLSRRKRKRLTQDERRFAEGRMMLYSPLGRGAVMTYG